MSNRLNSIIWDHACGQQNGESDPRDRLLLAQLAGHCDEEGVESTRGPRRRPCGCWHGVTCCAVCAPEDGRFKRDLTAENAESTKEQNFSPKLNLKH